MIITGSIGSGHVSVARAIKESLYRIYGGRVRCEIVDIITACKNIAATATKKIYLSSLKLSPKIYQKIFEESGTKEWPLKFYNALCAPFMQRKLLELMREIGPNAIVSTFPSWEIIVKKIREKYEREIKRKIPTVAVVTDSISVHRAWISGNPDFFIVANDDTAVSLKNLGVEQNRIKILGYPVSERFTRETPDNFYEEFGFSPRKKTLLLILAPGIQRKKSRAVLEALKKTALKNIQLVIVASGGERIRAIASRMRFPFPVRIFGWTNSMHRLVRGADIVLTKAGGATVMECIAAKKPMIIIDALPGQEAGNALLVEKYNLGAMLNKNPGQLDDAFNYIFKNEQLIKKNLAAQNKPHAAENTTKFLMYLVRQSG